ncbi:hypothetical protein FPZ24_12125 [Sphingomonas panacisoli]|uniref:Uncharacterized protein n=1 Tax=Sphingomonas panacisoli TaxID=1813879 RepID=A0A5B8LKP2_9SPHN|nr:hypothetical protein [Sphingomonas panacisoli]QDZ08132.1 hypothetical protein FPZ24_12125 [Sphingomonas panacisoli]
MKSPSMPPVLQAVGLACVPLADMPPGTALARKPVAAAVITLVARNDGHRDVVIKTMSDARPFEWPLPALIDDALVAGAPTVITEADCDVLSVETASRRFFVEPALAALANWEEMIDPVRMFGVGDGYDEAALSRRLDIPVATVTDDDVARCWDANAPQAAESIALANAVSRLTLWAHGAAFQRAAPDPMFETLLPLRERLMEIEPTYPELKAVLASRPYHWVASFAGLYRDYRARCDAGDTDARWVTFEDGTSYV